MQYRKYFLPDPRIYLSEKLDAFHFGTADEAKTNKWVSMKEGIEKYGEKQWLDIVVGLTCFTKPELASISYQQKEMWELFEKKIRVVIPIMLVEDIFEKYTRHMMQKYRDNGYQRL